MSYIPGAGFKKPLNQLENPIVPDIKKGPTRFQWSGKHWKVDTAQTLLDTEANQQLIEPSILAQSRDHGRDQYGHSSYQEKITVFRMPLQNHYEDFGPLNRLPTKIHAIQPRINPGTAFDSNSAYVVNNSSIPEMSKYITDRISTREWRETFYAPMSGPEDNRDIVEPDLVYSLPIISKSAGYTTQNTKDAYNPKSDYRSEVQKPQTYASAGYTSSNYEQPLYQQTSNELPGGELISNLPARSISSGFSTSHTKDGSTGVEYFELESKTTPYSVSSGYTTMVTQDGEINRDYNLQRKGPATSVSSGFTTQNTQNAESRLEDLEFQSKLSAPTRVLNPSSETGYQTRMESYTSPEMHLKIRENPKVAVAAHHQSSYRDLNSEQQQFKIRTKIQPVKSYNSGLNSGTVKTSGVQSSQIKLKHESMKGVKTYSTASTRKV